MRQIETTTAIDAPPDEVWGVLMDNARYPEWNPFITRMNGQIALGQRLDTLWTTPPIPFRRQNAGDYRIPELTLRDELAPGEAGFGIHVDRTRA